MAKGDQIYVMRELPVLPHRYEHHGIDCGDGTVIHYRKVGEAAITRTTMAEFAAGQPVITKLYSTCFLPHIVVSRAESRLGEHRYDLFINNCEHFATWCKTGRSESAQLINYGLYPELLNVSRLQPLIDQATYQEDPAQALNLFKRAIANLASAEQSIRPQYNQALIDADTWHRVALLALQRGREDLARAALRRKYDAKKTLERLQPQIQEIDQMRQKLQQDSQTLRQRIEVSTPTL